MVIIKMEYEDGSLDQIRADLPLLIGRGEEAGVRIRAWRVARQHAEIQQRDAGLFIDDKGALTGTYVNGRRVTEYGPLCEEDEIIIGPCRIWILNSTQRVPEKLLKEPVHTKVVAAVNADISSQLAYREQAQYRRRLHTELLDALNLRRRDIAAMSDTALRLEATELLNELIKEIELPQTLDQSLLIQEVVNEAVGLGVLEPLLAEPAISEIMVNRYDEIFIESHGRLSRYHGGFSSEQAVLGVIERIVSPLGRRIDESAPMVDARLADGSRVNAIIPPVALRGASLTIRKFPQRRLNIQDLLQVGALDTPMAHFLQACIKQRKNVVVSGGTGSGKTTLLNILSNAIPEGERIVTIEDAAELKLAHAHLVALEARPPNLEGKGAIPIRDLVRNALRMRPDRIVVGECRGAEAFDMLAAMNTGHEGSLTTLHANSPRDALSRLETMILMAGMDLPLSAVRDQVASSIDIIVQQARLATGQRVITSIMQVCGQEGGRIQLQELFRFEPGPPACFIGCGLMPDGFVITEEGLGLELFNQRSEQNKTAGHWHTSAAPYQEVTP